MQALAKGGRDELAIQAATELGVDAVIPWAAQRSIVRWEGAKALKGQQRWASIVREATKQSLRAWIPDVGEPADHRSNSPAVPDRRGCSCSSRRADRPSRPSVCGAGVARGRRRDLFLVVGPEGGVAPAGTGRVGERRRARVRLGEAVLRTSTAGPAALAVLNGVLGRW